MRNHWKKGFTKGYVEELEKKAAKLEQLEAKIRLQPFVENFSSKVMMLLAYMPIASWPLWIQEAFRLASREMPTAGHEYEALNHKYSLKK